MIQNTQQHVKSDPRGDVNTWPVVVSQGKREEGVSECCYLQLADLYLLFGLYGGGNVKKAIKAATSGQQDE